MEWCFATEILRPGISAKYAHHVAYAAVSTAWNYLPGIHSKHCLNVTIRKWYDALHSANMPSTTANTVNFGGSIRWRCMSCCCRYHCSSRTPTLRWRRPKCAVRYAAARDARFFKNKIVSTIPTSCACFSAFCVSLDPAVNAWYADFAFFLSGLTVGLECLKRCCPNNRHYYCMEWIEEAKILRPGISAKMLITLLTVLSPQRGTTSLVMESTASRTQFVSGTTPFVLRTCLQSM